jgi:hypothetical protein
MKRPSPIAKRPSAELKPVPSETNWTVREVREVPSFYPLERSSRSIVDNPFNVASRLSDACRLMSVQATYDDSLATADLVTADRVEIHLTLWKGEEKERTTTIVEAQRRKGCAVVYHRYCRDLLDAAQGVYEAKEDNKKLLHRVEVERKEDEDDKSALYALEMAAKLLRKDRMDATRLGMESLCLLTDPSQTGMENARIASQVVLFGSVQEPDAKQEETDFIQDELGIREAILSLVQFGKLREHCDFDSDSEDEDNVAGVEAEFNDILHNLALAVLANALEVHEKDANNITTEDSKPSANTFLEESKEISKRELLGTLLSTLGKAASKPHDACLSAQCLKSLFQGSKEAKSRAKDLNAKQIVMTALDVGRRTHVKLETETENVIKELERPDEDEGVARGSNEQHNDEDESEEE